ncbi:unnamed protein product [Lymnaea stagnalis]|uniref:DNA-directed RNA polymerase n=1 Tax=Lymnaea stagnalis TaxID=6523 RepID=A0AAV2HJR1_LYMST
MSFIKFTLCRRLICAQRDLKQSVFLAAKFSHNTRTLSFEVPSILRHSENVGIISEFRAQRSYSASASVKPHMTLAMQKWKRKKRKSKTQQKKEMEQLQQDLVKLLTKRAIQLVKDKSLLGARRTIVMTHVFTNLHDSLNADNGLMTAISSEAGDVVTSSKFRNSSDLVAHHLEAHIMNPYKTSKRLLKDSSKSNQKQSSPLMHNPVLIENEGYNLESKDFKPGGSFDKWQDTRISDIPKESEAKYSSTFTKPFDYFELFPESAKLLKQPLTSNSSTDFSACVEKFKSDLEQEKELHLDGSYLNNESISELKENKFVDENKLKSMSFADKTTISKTSLQITGKKIHLPSSTKMFSERVAKNTLNIDYEDNTCSMVEAILMESNYPMEKDDMYTLDEIDVTSQKKNAEQVKFVKKNNVTTTLKVPVGGSHPKSKTAPNEKKHLKHFKQSNINVSGELQELNDASFAEACCFTGYELLAVRNLQYQSTKHKIGSVQVFNKLIHSLAKKRDLQTIKNLFSLLKKQGLLPTLQTYAGCLECIGRMHRPDTTLCAKILSDVKNNDLCLEEIANKCSFESDEFTYVLKAIKFVEPDFVPNPANFVMQYKNNLLDELNVNNEKTIEKNQYAIQMRREDILSRASRQIEIEKNGEIVVDSIYTSSRTQLNPKLKQLQNKVLEDWKKVLTESFEQKLAGFEKRAHDNVNMTLYPYLKLLPPEDYVNIIFKCLKELFSTSEGYSPTQVLIRSMLGNAVNLKYNIATRVATGMDVKIMKLYEDYMESYLDPDFDLDNHRHIWLRAVSKNYDTVNMDLSPKKWPVHIHREIGKFLLEMILYDLKIDANLLRTRAPERLVPAFCTIFRPDVSLLSNSEIKLHPVVTKLFKVDTIESFSFDPSIVPMLVPPVPWISRNIGGLLLGSNALVRMPPDMHHVDILKKSNASQYPAVLDSLNTVGACAWIMNKSILDLQIEIFNKNGNPQLKVSPSATDLPPLPNITPEMTGKEKLLVYRERMQLQQQKQDVHGLWCSDLYRLSIANKYRDEVFWFPHSLDFRGRTYPLPPHFNHLGSDNVRGMLLFAKGKPLGEKGYEWIKIHLVNLTGFKKRCSNQERLQFADEMLEEIMDSADYPLTGRKWWQKADEPWQALACCMEIAKIERFQGKKEDYICHFPVHQDGSCNGLQHYAALGRDQAGAESVNLHPFSSPKDVYSDVVELVEKVRKENAEQGSEIAKILDGFIKRKVIKQTIMTTVYGVTRYGAKAQIHRQLKDIPDFPSEHAWAASLYLTETTFMCLREMFKATKDIQDWLTEAASLISSFAPVEWVTPLGFPVFQPYYKRLSKAESKHDKFKPNTMKQKNAFPPNYIHSLDSTHMMLTSLYCMHAGITFVSVHDCFWTHACDVAIMNKICREQFVNMHKQPLLENLSEHLVQLVQTSKMDPNLQEAVKDCNIPALIKLLTNVPKRGTFNLDNVLESTYFFS